MKAFSTDMSRREILKNLAASFMIMSLCELSWTRRALSNTIQPVIVKWLTQVNELAHSMKKGFITQAHWQKQMCELFSKIELAEFLKFIDFEALQRRAKLPSSGEMFEDFVFPQVEGMPEDVFFYTDIAGFRKESSIPPHGHNHLVSSFLVLNGQLQGRHFDRIRDDGDYVHLLPSIDKIFQRGDFSTVSQFKDNVHWFTAKSDHAFIFDFGVGGLTSSGTTVPYPNPNPLKKGRLYLDINPAQAISADGIFIAERIDEETAYSRYG